jgi:lambda family phage portal protein
LRNKPFNAHTTLSELKQDYRADYSAGTPSRFRRTRTGLYGSGDSHYANEQKFLLTREYVRDMDRNDAVVGPIVDRAVDNQVQQGLRLEPQTGDPKLDTDLAARFHAWSSDADECDASGEWTFPEMERLITRAEYVDGDQFALPLDDGSLQLVEAHRCRTPTNTRLNVVHGVLLDKRRRPLQYWFCPDNLDPYARFDRVGDAVKIDARDEEGNKQVFHLYKPNRVTQTRGVTAFKAVFDICGMLEDTNFAVLVKQQFAACLMAFLERTESFASDPRTGERRLENLVDGTTATVEGIAPGMFLRGAKGEKLSMLSPNIPANEYFQHMEFLLNIIGINLGLPLLLVLMNSSHTNFSGYRAEFDQAKIGFRNNQARRVNRFYRPVYQWKVRQWLTEDPALRSSAKRSGISIFGHRWNLPGWPYIQPLHDAQADVLRMNNLLASPTQIHAEDGGDFRSSVKESIRDNGLAIELAITEAQRLEKATGEKVNWRDVLNRDLPRGGQIIDAEKDELATGSSAPTTPSPRKK